MTFALVAETDTSSDQPLRRQYNDWRFYQISIS